MSWLGASVQEGTSLSGVSFPPPTRLITAPPVCRLLCFASLDSLSLLRVTLLRLLCHASIKAVPHQLKNVEKPCVSHYASELDQGWGGKKMSMWWRQLLNKGLLRGDSIFFLGCILTREVLQFSIFGTDQNTNYLLDLVQFPFALQFLQ